MPLYDYVCANCGYEVEVMHSVHGHGPSTCPSCGGPLKKAIVAPAVHFKGSGWARKERSGSARPSRVTSGESDRSQGGASEPSASATAGPAAGNSAGADPAAKDSD